MKNRPEPKQFPDYYDQPYKLEYQHDVKFPVENLKKLLSEIEIMQNQSKLLSEDRIKVIHREYKSSIDVFDDIREIDLKKYLEEIE